MSGVGSHERVTKLVARSLGLGPQDLIESLRSATHADLDAIVALRRRVLGPNVTWNDREYLSWRYGLAPAALSHATFHVLDVGGRILAGVGAERFDLNTPHGIAPAVCGMDILAEDSVRDTGIGPWLNLSLFQMHSIVLALGSNATSRGMVAQLYDTLHGRNVYHLPLDVKSFVHRHFRRRLVGVLYAALADGIVRSRNRWLELTRRTGEVHVDAPAALGPDIDREWSSDRYGGSIGIRRSASYLNWRFFDNPRAEYRALVGVVQDRPAALLVFRVNDQAADGPVMHVVDWWLRTPGESGAFLAILDAALAEARRRRVAYLSATALGPLPGRLLQSAGFIRRSAFERTAAVHCTAESVQRTLADSQHWNLTGLGDDSESP